MLECSKALNQDLTLAKRLLKELKAEGRTYPHVDAIIRAEITSHANRMCLNWDKVQNIRNLNKQLASELER